MTITTRIRCGCTKKNVANLVKLCLRWAVCRPSGIYSNPVVLVTSVTVTSHLRPNFRGILPENSDCIPLTQPWGSGWWRRHKNGRNATLAHCMNPLAIQCLFEYWVFVGGLTISDSIFVTRWLLNSIKASHRGGSITNLWCALHVTCGRSATSCSSVGSCWSISCTSDIWTLLCLNIKIQHFAQLLAVTLTWVLLQGDTCLVCLCMHAFWLLKTKKG